MLAPKPPSQRPEVPRWLLVGVAAAAALVSLGLVGRSVSSSGPRTLAPAGTTIFTLIIAVWAVGLITLGVLLLGRARVKRKG